MLFVELICVFLFIASSQADSDEEEDCILYIKEIYNCDNTEAKTEVKVDSRKSGDHTNIFNIELDISENVNKNTSFEMVIDRWEDGAWKNFHNQVGALCENIEQMGSKANQKLRSVMNPAIEDDCEVTAGHYEVSDFELTSDDIDVPLGQEDTLKVTMKYINGKKEEIACVTSEMEILC